MSGHDHLFGLVEGVLVVLFVDGDRLLPGAFGLSVVVGNVIGIAACVGRHVQGRATAAERVGISRLMQRAYTVPAGLRRWYLFAATGNGTSSRGGGGDGGRYSDRMMMCGPLLTAFPNAAGTTDVMK